MLLTLALPQGAAAEGKGKKASALRPHTTIKALENRMVAKSNGVQPKTQLIIRKARGAKATSPFRVKARAPQLPKQPAYKVPFRADVASVKVNGILNYSDNWVGATAQYGIYEFPTYSNGYNLITQDDQYGVSTAVYAGGKYYLYSLDNYGFFVYSDIKEVDVETGELTNERTDYSAENGLFTGAYSAAEDCVYGFFYNSSASGLTFGTLNRDDLSADVIAEIPNEELIQYAAIAFDSSDQLWGIDFAGTVYKIDKSTGAGTPAFETGLASVYTTSGAIDKHTNIFYYVENNYEAVRMYAIDLATGAFTQTDEYADNPSMAGLFFPAPAAEANAPAAVTDLSVVFDGPSLTGTVSFTAPTTTYDGTPANGPLTYFIRANGELVAQGTTAYGETVNAEVTLQQGGQVKFTVSVANAEGDGAAAGESPKANTQLWVGYDELKAVGNVQLAYADGKVVLTWDQPEPLNGGFFDPAQVTYTVYKDGEKIATDIKDCTFTKEHAEGAYEALQYAVSATVAGMETYPTYSNIIALGTIYPPYTNDFSELTSLAGFTQINEATDLEWTTGYGSAQMSYSATSAMDAWLISPKVKLYGGKIYRISFDLANANSQYPERAEVFLGTKPTVEAMTTTVLEKTDLAFDGDGPLHTVYYFQAPKTAEYYLGVHGCSDPDMYVLKFSNLSIDEGKAIAAPAEVDNVVVKPDEGQSKTVSISFNAPAKSISGTELSSLTEIKVLRDNEEIKTFEAPKPGAQMSMTDEVAEDGHHTYTFIPANMFDAGYAKDVKTYVGVNKPAGPTDPQIKETEPGVVYISWTAPTKDIDGLPLGSAKVTYSVYGFDNSGDPVLIADQIEETNYTFLAVDEGEQDFVYYAITASTEAGMGDEIALTDMIAVGTPWPTPVVESFADAGLTYNFATQALNGCSAQWGISDDSQFQDVTSQDGDNGFAYCKFSALYDAAELLSGKIAVNGDEHLSYYYLPIAADCENTITLSVICDGERHDLSTVTAGGDAEGWQKVDVSLAEFAGKSIQFVLTGECYSHVYTIVDHLSVAKSAETDLAMVNLTAPSKVKPGEEYWVTATVANKGAKQVDAYKVNLYRNGKLVASQDGEPLAAGEKTGFGFTQKLAVIDTPNNEYTAEVVAAGDEDAANNTMAAPNVALWQPNYPAPTDLKATKTAEGVELAWTAPDTQNYVPAITDSFEDYEPFEINKAGDWTIIDGDQQSTYIIDGYPFPNQGEPMGFMVFDGPAVIDQDGAILGHTGNKSIVTFATEQGANDDWMISPELNGTAQTVSFFAKSYTTDYGCEKFEFLYSTGSTDIADFQKIGETTEVDFNWTEFSYTLPEGAKYFAIHCVSQDCFIFMVDDVTYQPAGAGALVLEGYNVYRNGEKINDTPIAAAAYTDTEANGLTQYTVTAVYSVGESVGSNVVEVELPNAQDMPLGIDAQTKQATRIATDKNLLIIRNATGSDITVYSADGKTIYSGAGSQLTTVRAESGTYVVKIGRKTTKAYIK